MMQLYCNNEQCSTSFVSPLLVPSVTPVTPAIDVAPTAMILSPSAVQQ